MGGKCLLSLETHPLHVDLLCVWVAWVLRVDFTWIVNWTIRVGLLTETDTAYFGAMEHDALQTTTVTKEHAIMLKKRTVHVTAGKRSYTNDFFFRDVQDECIIGLDLLEWWRGD